MCDFVPFLINIVKMDGISFFRPGVLDEDEQPNEVNKIRSLANDLQSQLEVSCK